MKLQSKVLAILASLWVVLCLIIYVDSKLTLEKNYQKLEYKLAVKDMNRAQKALSTVLSKLELYTTSYAMWDEEYNFVKKQYQLFINSNFGPNTFTSSKNNFYIYFNNNGNLYYGKAFDLNTQSYVTIPPELLAALKPLASNLKIGDKHTGIIKIPQGYVAFSILPVLTGEGHGPVYGSIMMGYYINENTFEKISQTVEMNVYMIPLPLKQNDASANIPYQKLTMGFDEYFNTNSSDLIDGFSFIKDIFNKPIAIMKVQIPRELYGEGLLTIYHYLAIVMGLGIIILITVWFLLKKLVIDRIINISNQVVSINKEANFFKRIFISGNDEMTKMTTSLNSMLELIELTQEQLKYRISRRSKELEKISHLNKNLLSEMGKQRSIETKLREDEKLLRKLAYYDPLTGLPNRTFFHELVINAISRSENNKSKIAILFIDIDKFKKVNDTYGHEFANKFLKEVAHQLKSAITDSDVVARIGGDEFLIFLDNVTDTSIIDKAITKIYKALESIKMIDNIKLTTYFSMGISIFPDDGRTLEELINQADLAMYYAKKHEGNIYYYYKTIKDNRHSTS